MHFGLRLSTFAIIDQATRKKYRRRIPAKYRKLSDQAGDIRYNPLSYCIPSTQIHVRKPVAISLR